MIVETLGTALSIATISLVGVFFFGNSQRLRGAQRYVTPIAVGVYLSLVMYELIPETVARSPQWGGITVAVGFIAFYLLASVLHKRHNALEANEADPKEAAVLLLIGDGIHNLADGVVLGSAFLIDPTIGFVTAIGFALHEIPQEIVEFGILIRAGYTVRRAALYNFLSASSIFVGTLIILFVAAHIHDFIWIITGIAAGNLLFLAASDLLPRIHNNPTVYGSVQHSATSMVFAFIVMTGILMASHEYFTPMHELDDGHFDHPHTHSR